MPFLRDHGLLHRLGAFPGWPGFGNLFASQRLAFGEIAALRGNGLLHRGRLRRFLFGRGHLRHPGGNRIGGRLIMGGVRSHCLVGRRRLRHLRRFGEASCGRFAACRLGRHLRRGRHLVPGRFLLCGLFHRGAGLGFFRFAARTFGLFLGRLALLDGDPARLDLLALKAFENDRAALAQCVAFLHVLAVIDSVFETAGGRIA